MPRINTNKTLYPLPDGTYTLSYELWYIATQTSHLNDEGVECSDS